jgi:hypothetical protein
MKTSLIASIVSLFLVSSAFAGPVYHCLPTDTTLAPLQITIESNEKKVAFSTILDGKLDPETAVTLDQDQSQDGYTEYSATGGCNQNGNGPHCFAMWVNRLSLSEALLSRAEEGVAILNGDNYSCQLQ